MALTCGCIMDMYVHLYVRTCLCSCVQVKKVAQKNVEKAASRGDNLSDLQDRAGTCTYMYVLS